MLKEKVPLEGRVSLNHMTPVESSLISRRRNRDFHVGNLCGRIQGSTRVCTVTSNSTPGSLCKGDGVYLPESMHWSVYGSFICISQNGG